jgi:hypothetical protein
MLPPFDSPLDPATLEGMAAASSAAGSTGGVLNEVTSEQLWVGRRWTCFWEGACYSSLSPVPSASLFPT